MNDSKKISIVTVTYNCVEVLERTIQSIINQTYQNTEYIIIDGASKDGSCDTIEKYKNKISYYISEPDKGIYDAMNKAVQIATGNYIIFMNAGDSFYSDDVLDKFVPFIEEDTIVAYGNIMKVAKGYQYVAYASSPERMSDFMTVFHQSSIIRLDYHKKNLFNLQYRSSADYNFFYNAYLRDRVKFQYIPLILANFDCCDGTSNTNYKRSQRESLKIRGIYTNIYERLKKELWMFNIDIKKFIKNKFLSKEHIRDIEIARLKREGIKDIEVIPFV